MAYVSLSDRLKMSDTENVTKFVCLSTIAREVNMNLRDHLNVCHLSVCLSFVSLSVFLLVCLSIWLSPCLSLCLSVNWCCDV